MFFALLFSTLLWQSVHAMSPDERAEQKAIEAECKPLLADSQIIYNTCIAKGGQRSQAARKQAGANEPAKPVVCNPSGALSACEASSDRAAKINNPNAPDIEVEEAIIACRSACNPQSSQVLAKYLDDCGTSANAQTEQMKAYLNKCGYKVSSSQKESIEMIENEPTNWSLADRMKDFIPSKETVMGLLPVKLKEIGFEGDWIGGKSESTTNSFANVYSMPLSQDIDYVKTVTRDGAVAYKYRSKEDGSYHDSYASAESYNKRLSGPSFGKPSLPPPPTAPPSDGGLSGGAEDNTSIAERADLAPDESPNPPPRPDDFRAPPGEGRQEPVAGGGGNGGNTSGGGGAAPQDPVVRQPPPSPQPVVEGNDGAFVNNALNSPIGSGGGMSPVSAGDSSEVSSGSGSSSSAGYANLGGGSSSRGNFQGSGRQPSPIMNDSPEIRPAGAGTTGDTNINGNIAAGGRGSASGMGDVSGGRMVASASRPPPATLDSFGFQGEKMRSDNFYKTPGKGVAPSRARLVKVDPNCKGKNCQWKSVPVSGDSASVNCEGNPQCLLALTGPLSAKKKKQLNDYWKTQKMGDGRGVASAVASTEKAVEPNSPKYIKGTWWKGIDSIVRHKEIIDQCFQTDHAGDLQSNCDL